MSKQDITPQGPDPDSLLRATNYPLQKYVFTDSFPKLVRDLRERIYAEVSEDDAHLELGRVEDFMRSKGLTVGDYLVLNQEGLSKVRTIIQSPDFMSDVRGFHHCALRIAFVLRIPEIEAANGTVFTESLLVHELAHRSNGHGPYRYEWQSAPQSKWKFTTPRTGFQIRGYEGERGTFFEEGFAELLRSAYIEAHPDPKMAASIAAWKPEVYGAEWLHCGLLRFNDVDNIGTFVVPKKYLHVEGENISLGEGALAAATLELLCHQEPKLFGTMIEARKDPKKLAELVQLVDRLQPGLYGQLRRVEYGMSEFAAAQRLVFDTFSGGAAPDWLGRI